ncbi:1,4-alpha-glucan branching protein GlgB [Aliivibrio sp. S4TY2]|uniref:1,4-alpha-glucan branching protein GlgB n=1 Tax=unclassified Aliivibrio TaxID=2645654 RepID=UPI002377FC3F|nr:MULTISPECIES: 1,4-alpha-glucan branching protein GlgB [unclassified Aliivibrio]MDD9156265.1 1,4-alpha-glucan branching protein GlgB [Aliivibrio sp. S4TY2]MDD9160612.1 1,4-alpha-glucan branching protein GlgB [Aliivibrio sp. S4TY1]MDD9163972.1 1,4-alpha-glucan branching protein GlgB [Aliivibrio sp. S4MY2]MDD9168053.1 1,4-alpha-glucan branching protein GlgB [Aliivibrio sp. S4MY4]MDD9185169.1 1,4-alpha-glucan branching protein GlgB [Aliivibrio sp. S4MY3]
MQLERAAFSDPFSFLGPQYQSTDIALRVWLPGATSVSARLSSNQKNYILHTEPSQEGMFILNEPLDLTDQHYQLVVNWDGIEQVIDDPYQYHDIAPSDTQAHTPKEMYNHLGAHIMTVERCGESVQGVRYVVFAPNASAVSVIGDFNQWDGRRHLMQRIDNGLWALFIPEHTTGVKYKFELKGPQGEALPHKMDPFGAHNEQYPSFASVVYDQASYQWQDSTWQTRSVTQKQKEALSFYELHAGSWKRNEQGEFLTYRELAEQLIPYMVDMGYTHLELMPVSEHPFYGSWGYQPIGLFSPTSRFGTPDDFKYFVDQCHQAGLGVVLDWVPAHFPSDSHGLANFDGTSLFNDPDPRRGWHNDWQSFIYNYDQQHVREFLVSNALYWFEHFHIDGLRVDAVASMLYLDYSREDGEWIPNWDGGNHNHGAIALLKWMNEEVYSHYPNAMTIAEESTAFPGVSAPTFDGGLGFGFKWNMGWMHDSLSYIQEDPIHRRYHHDTITFPMVYAFSENYVLSLSHDEVVYGKGAILDKMPGDEWQKTANMRAYMGYMYGQPGKKLNFMGAEIAQSAEWDHDSQLQWFLTEFDRHSGMQALVRDLNKMYTSQPALYQNDCSSCGFEWRLQDEAEMSVLAHERLGDNGERILVVSNFTPTPRENFRLGMPVSGEYELLLNSDAHFYGGSNYDVVSKVKTESIESQGLPQSILITLPPLSTVFYRLK